MGTSNDEVVEDERNVFQLISAVFGRDQERCAYLIPVVNLRWQMCCRRRGDHERWAHLVPAMDLRRLNGSRLREQQERNDDCYPAAKSLRRWYRRLYGERERSARRDLAVMGRSMRRRREIRRKSLYFFPGALPAGREAQT